MLLTWNLFTFPPFIEHVTGSVTVSLASIVKINVTPVISSDILILSGRLCMTGSWNNTNPLIQIQVSASHSSVVLESIELPMLKVWCELASKIEIIRFI
jgi:hypothetical protein